MTEKRQANIVATRQSIRAWKNKWAATVPGYIRTGPKECALCVLHWENECNGCPVAHAARDTTCAGTPYPTAYRALEHWKVCYNFHGPEDPKTLEARDKWREHAWAEVEFLEKVLKELQ